ncbi:Glycosyl transferase family 2 [Proteiniphilum saccharofermentans]|uniref:Glycosyl transferase family 2 n=1 Tax=Proteiniphilum saccharofermentans TaxID=1642647 RepID=A0A1R3T1K6_9BACT|nr:glycosyltransferase family 2 protein [Proteiniphilum saccharofermentans]SCD19078.1 Glycosyl transferase family 2 [Proteiniphilum saccharofermentans]
MKLSVITVTWNAEKTVERTLKSVQEQTYPHLEHLIVDGASVDGTLRIIQEYSEGDLNIQKEGSILNRTTVQKRLRWISEPDQGLYNAMNKAIGMASGDYLCFLNAGDTFYAPDTVERMMQSFDRNKPPDILYGETAIVDDKGSFLHMRRLKAPGRLTWKSFKQGMLVCHQAFIVKRELTEPYDLSYRFSSDFDWCIRMMKKAISIHNTRLTLVNYLNEGMTTANHKASLKERYRIMAKYYGHISTLFHHVWFVIRAVLK